ncbi:hypothetical protein BRC83_08230 [Halobacteriales archaeon QS_1_68_17]|nr:MAG: hypothetical protein BRC83_08230 [Halobacteriales archaeon QS_1_68_17]
MTRSLALPGLETCVAVYLDAWDAFGTDRFDAGTLRARRAGRSRDPAADRPHEHVLDLLVAYGLLAWHGGTAYSVRCAPDADREEWAKAAAGQAGVLYAEVQDRISGQSQGSADRDGTVRFRSETYVRVAVDPADEFRDVAATVRKRLAETRESGRVALVAPGTDAGHVQRIADRLCDRGEATAAGLGRHFEKVDSDVVSGTGEELTFRLFLRPADA